MNPRPRSNQQPCAIRTFDKEFLGRLPVEVVVGILTRGGSGEVADSMEILKVTGGRGHAVQDHQDEDRLINCEGRLCLLCLCVANILTT